MALAPAGGGGFIALSYHEVGEKAIRRRSPRPPRSAPPTLRLQFAWLKVNGYTPVNVNAIIAARKGGAPLPAKAILLTFDDGGLKDVYTRVFPLLKQYNYPAVIALVGTWLDVEAGKTVDYDGVAQPRERLRHLGRSARDAALRAWSKSPATPTTCIAASSPIRKAIPSRRQSARLYADGRYEQDGEYLRRGSKRISRASSRSIERQTGIAPRIIVWPYGRSNLASQEIAARLGMSLRLYPERRRHPGLDAAAPDPPLPHREQPAAAGLCRAAARHVWPPDPARSVRLAPGQWQDDNAELSATLDRLLALQPNTAFVSPPSRSATAGNSRSSPPSRLPLARDSLNHIAWQTERRAGVPVFIDLPDHWLGDSGS